jgi:hypothetical protein
MYESESESVRGYIYIYIYVCVCVCVHLYAPCVWCVGVFCLYTPCIRTWVVIPVTHLCAIRICV